MKESLRVKGKLKIYKNGNLEKEIDNLVVTTGLNWITARLITAGIPDPMSHMAVGTGTTAADASDTAMETIVGARKAFDSTTVTANAIEYVSTFAGSTYAGALTEAGLFNALTTGTMLSHVIFSVINVAAADEITCTWTLTFANA